jgi:hypothetical protein
MLFSPAYKLEAKAKPSSSIPAINMQRLCRISAVYLYRRETDSLPNQGLGVGGVGAGGVYMTLLTGWFTTCFGGSFFFGFLISRLRASLFPMADSLPQVSEHFQKLSLIAVGRGRRGSQTF